MTMTDIVIDLELPPKPPRDKTVSAKINAYEHQLLKYLASKCNTTVSTLVENAISLLIYTMLSNSKYNIPGGPAWDKIVEDMGLKTNNFIKNCLA
ncbi:MAG: hypothetical protein GSR85_09365 [Desulfurococcales archaeon]|nr:hypothetical protein [Desulfurococcales archaeon]